MRHVAAGCGAEGIELSVELGLGFDEGPSVVTHGLVAGIWVLGYDCKYCGDQDHDEEDEGECGVDDEKDHSDNAGDNALEESQ